MRGNRRVCSMGNGDFPGISFGTEGIVNCFGVHLCELCALIKYAQTSPRSKIFSNCVEEASRMRENFFLRVARNTFQFSPGGENMLI